MGHGERDRTALAVLANVLLIPQLGVVGSAISISLCEALMLAMRSYVCRGFLVGIRTSIDPIRILLSAIAAGCLRGARSRYAVPRHGTPSCG